MKTTKFIVIFVTGKIEIVHAFNKKEALILAKANQIKEGNIYKVERIVPAKLIHECLTLDLREAKKEVEVWE